MLLSAISNFRNEAFDRSKHASKLALISLILGALYSAVTVMEVFGIVAAVTQRIVLVRLYAFMSVLGSLIVVGAALFRTVIHFVLKHDIINECTDESTGETVIFTFGLWGPTTHETLNAQQASEWCNNAWSQDSSSEIVSVIILIFLSALFTSVAFAYYRQVLDPSNPSNLSRTPARNTNAYPSHYAPAYNYNASVPNLPYMPEQQREEYGYDEQFAPPYEPGKLPGYGAGDGNFKAREDVKGAEPFSDFDGTHESDAGDRK